MRLRLEIKPQDCWIGVFWRTKKGAQGGYDWVDVWVCVLPMVPLHIYWPRRRKPAECDHECHRRPWNFYSWKFCPRCGGALKQEG